MDWTWVQVMTQAAGTCNEVVTMVTQMSGALGLLEPSMEGLKSPLGQVQSVQRLLSIGRPRACRIIASCVCIMPRRGSFSCSTPCAVC